MKFRYSPVALAVFAALGSVTVAPATAQQTAQSQTLERVTITGSNIRRTDQETVAPVEIITREQIERTGQPTIAEVIRQIPANLGGSFSESFSNSFAPGAAGLSLRGLGQKTTLVLINGRRTANYGYAQNLQDTFVDFNSIPSSAVERIEILKDGASAIYGSDAIAGVINVILRRDYKGIEVGGNVGYFEGANDYRANIVAGIGEPGKDKYNLFGVFDYYKRDFLSLADTKFGETRDMRGEQGGRNLQSLTGGGTWRQLNATNGLTNVHQATAGCTGQIISAAQAVERGLMLPNNAFNLPGNTFCAKDFNYAFTAIPETERYGFLGRGTFDFSATTQGYAELGYSKTETFQTFQESFFAGTTGLRPTAAGLSPFTYNINFGPGVAGNPFPTNARYVGVLADLGTRDTEIDSDTYRVLAGIKYSLIGWDFDSAVGWSKNEVVSRNFNGLSKSGVSAVFGVPTTAQPPVPVSMSSTYNLNTPSVNSQAVRDQMRINFDRTSESELKFIDTRATTEIGTLPGGAIGLALGAEFRQESLRDVADPALTTGDILGRGLTATDGERDNFAMYAELALPLTRQLEAQLALRYDDYSDFGSALTPKVGVKFKATPELLFRANWGRGFRAPSLPEISPSVATFFTTVNDPLFPLAPPTSVSGSFAGNPNLEPEKSRSTTIGFVWEPNNAFNVGVDFYQISWSNIVVGDCCQDIVDAGDPARVIRDPQTNQIVTVVGSYLNLPSMKTQGVDFDTRYTARTTYGRFTTRLNATYVDEFEEDGVEYAGTNGGTNTYPRWKGYISLDWDNGPFAVTGRVNYIHHYYQQLLNASFFTAQDPRFQNGTYPEKISSYTTLDLFARYAVTPNLNVTGAILNVTDEVPPYDPGFSSTNLYDFSQYDVRGIQFRLGVNYKFR